MKLHNFDNLAKEAIRDLQRRVNIERHRHEAIAEIVEYSLAQLRKHRRITHAQLAEALGITQASVSRVEHVKPADAQLVTLRNYIEALGGDLEITSVIDGEQFPLSVS